MLCGHESGSWRTIERFSSPRRNSIAHVPASDNEMRQPVKAECVSMCGLMPMPGGYSFTVIWSTGTICAVEQTRGCMIPHSRPS